MNDEELDEHLDMQQVDRSVSVEQRIAKLMREAYWLGHAEGHEAGWRDGR